MYRTLAALSLVGLAAFANAARADVKYLPKTEDKVATIVVYGTIASADIEPFIAALNAIVTKDEAIVALASEGGNGLAALAIGDEIRRSGINTWISDNQTCASACATIWIAGNRKRAGANSHIGFHGAFDPDTGQQSCFLATLLGAHYAYLGYSIDAIVWLTSARGGDMHWLTPETAKKYNIYFDYDEKTPPTPPPYKYVPPSAPPPPPPVPPVASTQFSYRVTDRLQLRERPTKYSRNFLDIYAPYDFIPPGTTFTWKGRPSATDCVSGPGGEIWCTINYVHPDGTKFHGWISAHFLRSPTSQRLLACLFYNPDPECVNEFQKFPE